MTTQVGTLMPGEAFIWYENGNKIWCVNPDSSSYEVVDTGGSGMIEVIFLHTTFPTNGYVYQGILGANEGPPGMQAELANQNHGYGSITLNGLIYTILDVRYDSDVVDKNANYWITLPAGSQVAVWQGESGSTHENLMAIYGYKEPTWSSFFWPQNGDTSQPYFVDTHITDKGSGKGIFGIYNQINA